MRWPTEELLRAMAPRASYLGCGTGICLAVASVEGIDHLQFASEAMPIRSLYVPQEQLLDVSTSFGPLSPAALRLFTSPCKILTTPLFSQVGCKYGLSEPACSVQRACLGGQARSCRLAHGKCTHLGVGSCRPCFDMPHSCSCISSAVAGTYTNRLSFRITFTLTSQMP